MVQNLRPKGLTEGITLSSMYEDRKGSPTRPSGLSTRCSWKAVGTWTSRVTRTRCKPWRTRQGPGADLRGHQRSGRPAPGKRKQRRRVLAASYEDTSRRLFSHRALDAAL